MSELTIEGAIKLINPTRTISDKFEVCEFVLTTEGTYPQHIMFTAVNEAIDKVKPLQIGQNVMINFALRGREWKSPQGDVKYFNTIDVKDITALSPVSSASIDLDDLPF